MNKPLKIDGESVGLLMLILVIFISCILVIIEGRLKPKDTEKLNLCPLCPQINNSEELKTK